jgi:hypothetical protein
VKKAVFDAINIDTCTTVPVYSDWPHYSRLPGGSDHYHLGKGNQHVAVWRVKDNEMQLVEFTYDGKLEKKASVFLVPPMS